MTEPKWIEINYEGTTPSGKTGIWGVWTKDDNETPLGAIKWHSPWRRYAFYPCRQTIFEKDCLRDIANECEELTQHHPKATYSQYEYNHS